MKNLLSRLKKIEEQVHTPDKPWRNEDFHAWYKGLPADERVRLDAEARQHVERWMRERFGPRD